MMARRGIQIHLGGGKWPWDRKENGYPPRSHDCQTCESEFADIFEEAQRDFERREKNAKQKRTMMMWKNALDHVWNSKPIKKTRHLIDTQPKVMRAIIESEGDERSIE